MGTPAQRALVIESEPRRALQLCEALSLLGVDSRHAGDANDGWKEFARYRPTHVFAALHCGSSPGGEHFLRKLNSDFIGTMPKVYLTCSAQDLALAAATDPTAYVIWPIARTQLERIFDQRASVGETHGRQIARLRELYELTLLGSDLVRELDFVTTRATLGFQVSDCIIWGSRDEAHWPRSTQNITPQTWRRLRGHCELALRAGTTVMVSDGPATEALHEGEGQSLLAAPLGPVGEEPAAGICLISDDSRRLSGEARDSLRILARRLSVELAWMSAHNRLVDEHEKLRQTSLLDPLLGVWTRAALQQSIDDQLANNTSGKPLAIMLIDYKQLRAINDHYGHLTGDEVLNHFTKVAKASLRIQDQIGRFGGDELVALLVDANLEKAKSIAVSVIEALAQTPFEDEDVHIQIEARAGVTVIDPSERSSEAAFARANLALDNSRRSRLSVAALESGSDSLLDLGPSHVDLLSVGSTLGGMYRILHEISRGAMGVVYRGEDLGLGRPVAIKVLRSDLSSDEELVAKFRSEAALLASLRHRNLVQVYSFGTEGEDVYFVMELVEGEPLSQIVRRLGQEGSYVDLEALAKIVEEIAEALDAIHTLGIVHRDVKPENVLVDRINDRAVLVDVGIAKRQGDVRDAAGTPGYAAPESFMELDEGPQTDVYGLAATTYAVLTGSPPYEGDDLSAVVNSQLNEPPTPPTHFRSDLSPAADSVLATALAPEPSRRYRTANAFAIALNRALAKRPSRTRRSRTATIPAPFKTPATQRGARVSTYRVKAISAETDSAHGSSRGAIFRAAAMVLPRILGNQWVHSLEQSDPQVAALLKPTIPAQSWQLTAHLIRLLHCVKGHSDDPESVVRGVGAAVSSSSLARFYGAEPRSQSPSSLLKAAESYWRRYHSWGELEVHNTSAGACMVELRQGPGNLLFCEMLAGFFGQIPALTGAADAQCQIASCRQRGDEQCTFSVQWSPGTQ